MLRPALDSAIRVLIDGKQEKFSSALLASRWRMNFAVAESMSSPCCPVQGLPAHCAGVFS